MQDEQGNEYYVKPENPEEETLNDYGVKLILSKLAMYLNKNTVMSYYDEERINGILADIGDWLVVEIFCNYEKMGMDTPAKKSRYPLLVITILHIIESAYRRALRGKTLEVVNNSLSVNQNDRLGGRPAEHKKSFSLFRPSTWI